MDLVRDKKKRNLTPVVCDQRFRQMELPSGTPEKGRIKKRTLTINLMEEMGTNTMVFDQRTNTYGRKWNDQ